MFSRNARGNGSHAKPTKIMSEPGNYLDNANRIGNAGLKVFRRVGLLMRSNAAKGESCH